MSVSRCAAVDPLVTTQVCLQRWCRVSERQGSNYCIAHRTENTLSLPTALQNLRMGGSGRQLWRSSPIIPQTNKTKQPTPRQNKQKTKSQTKNPSPTKERPVPPVGVIPGVPFLRGRQWDLGREWDLLRSGRWRAFPGAGKTGRDKRDEAQPPPVYSVAATADGGQQLF